MKYERIRVLLVLFAFILVLPVAFSSCFAPDKEAGKYLLDLTSANRLFLLQAGLTEDHIDEARVCTQCHGEYFFSHRRMGAERGTMSAFITV